MKGNVKHPAMLHFLIKKNKSELLHLAAHKDIALLHRELQHCQLAQATRLGMCTAR